MQELGARQVVKAVGAELLQVSRQGDAPAPAANGHAAAQQQHAGQEAGQRKGQEAGGRPSTVGSGSFLANVGRHTGKTIEGEVLLDDAWATNQATTFLVAGERLWESLRVGTRWAARHASRRKGRGTCSAYLSHGACTHQTEPTSARPAGYETTANAITFTVYLLARNPGGQALADCRAVVFERGCAAVRE